MKQKGNVGYIELESISKGISLKISEKVHSGSKLVGGSSIVVGIIRTFMYS